MPAIVVLSQAVLKGFTFLHCLFKQVFFCIFIIYGGIRHSRVKQLCRLEKTASNYCTSSCCKSEERTCKEAATSANRPLEVFCL